MVLNFIFREFLFFLLLFFINITVIFSIFFYYKQELLLFVFECWGLPFELLITHPFEVLMNEVYVVGWLTLTLSLFTGLFISIFWLIPAFFAREVKYILQLFFGFIIAFLFFFLMFSKVFFFLTEEIIKSSNLFYDYIIIIDYKLHDIVYFYILLFKISVVIYFLIFIITTILPFQKGYIFFYRLFFLGINFVVLSFLLPADVFLHMAYFLTTQGIVEFFFFIRFVLKVCLRVG